MNRSISAKLTMLSNFDSTSRRLIPMIAPLRYTFSRPVRSKWKPAPTSMRAPIFPTAENFPMVGTVTRDRIFSVVLLPAPFDPMRPTDSPRRPWTAPSRTARKKSGAVRRAGAGPGAEGPHPSAPRREMPAPAEAVALGHLVEAEDDVAHGAPLD